MEKQTYNGWANYATWRVNLEMFDGIDPNDIGWNTDSAYALGQSLQQYAEEIIEEETAPGFARSYAMSFLADVDWREIAEHMIADYCHA